MSYTIQMDFAIFRWLVDLHGKSQANLERALAERFETEFGIKKSGSRLRRRAGEICKDFANVSRQQKLSEWTEEMATFLLKTYNRYTGLIT